jgi:hypothetical protein
MSGEDSKEIEVVIIQIFPDKTKEIKSPKRNNLIWSLESNFFLSEVRKFIIQWYV